MANSGDGMGWGGVGGRIPRDCGVAGAALNPDLSNAWREKGSRSERPRGRETEGARGRARTGPAGPARGRAGGCGRPPSPAQRSAAQRGAADILPPSPRGSAAPHGRRAEGAGTRGPPRPRSGHRARGEAGWARVRAGPAPKVAARSARAPAPAPAPARLLAPARRSRASLASYLPRVRSSGTFSSPLSLRPARDQTRTPLAEGGRERGGETGSKRGRSPGKSPREGSRPPPHPRSPRSPGGRAGKGRKAHPRPGAAGRPRGPRAAASAPGAAAAEGLFTSDPEVLERAAAADRRHIDGFQSQHRKPRPIAREPLPLPPLLA